MSTGSPGGGGGGGAVRSGPSTVSLEYEVRVYTDRAAGRALGRGKFVYARQTSPSEGGIYEVRIGSGGAGSAIRALEGTERPASIHVSRARQYKAIWTDAAVSTEVATAALREAGAFTPSEEDQNVGRLLAGHAASTFALEFADSSGNALTGTQTIVVGKRVQLQLRTRPAGGTIDASSVRWTLPAHKWVKSRTETTTTGSSDTTALSGTSVEFYWVASGSQTVQVSATIGGLAATGSLTYTVVAPTVSRFHLTTSTVMRTTGPDQIIAADRISSPTKEGCFTDATVEAPADGGGHIGITQLIRVNRWVVDLEDKRYTFGGASSNYVLDNGMGIIYNFGSHGTPTSISAGATATIGTAEHHDSPSVPFTAPAGLGVAAGGGLYKAGANEAFKVYLRYRPTGGIWVTLQKATWSWRGEAKDLDFDGTWETIVNDGMSPSSDGSANTELPTWSSNFDAVANVSAAVRTTER